MQWENGVVILRKRGEKKAVEEVEREGDKSEWVSEEVDCLQVEKWVGLIVLLRKLVNHHFLTSLWIRFYFFLQVIEPRIMINQKWLMSIRLHQGLIRNDQRLHQD